MISDSALLVRDTLIARGLETPMKDTGLSNDEKYARIKDAMTTVVETLGLDLNDDSLNDTPHRIAKMYVNFRMYDFFCLVYSSEASLCMDLFPLAILARRSSSS